MKIETFEIILASALDGITQYQPRYNTEAHYEAQKEVDLLLGILEKQKADGATHVGFQFEKRKQGES